MSEIKCYTAEENVRYAKEKLISDYELCKCYLADMLDGWENSKGANQEYGFVKGKGIEIYENKKG